MLCAILNAHSGVLFGEKDLRVLKTQWFDIIYPKRSEQTAAILYEKADMLYEEVSAQYGLTPQVRYPVVITPAVEQFNGFFTMVPYNHIVLYDTGLSGSSTLAVFSETFLSTFRHELTHAVTFNMKNEVWKTMGKIFGDSFSFGSFIITPGMAEGATLTSESSSGEGRLNNEYSKHYVKQAVIEKQFPGFYNVLGSSDINPSGDFYYFNGAFHQWLQETYGMQSYSQFWWKTANGNPPEYSFYNVFGITLETAWKLFYEAYEAKMPFVVAEPITEGLSYDLFEPECGEYSKKNNAGSLYKSLSAAQGRFVWFDSDNGRVFLAQKRESGRAKKLVSKKLFTLGRTDFVRLSNDGRFVTASYRSTNAGTQKARVKIYDIESNSFFNVKGNGLKEAVVLKNNDNWYLIAQKYNSQHYSISISKLIMSRNNRRVKKLEPYLELVQQPEVNPFAFLPLEQNEQAFAYLCKDKLKWSLCISNTEGKLIHKYNFPEGMVVSSIYYDDKAEEFYFSYTQDGTMPRIGKLNIKSNQLYLTKMDISGGIYEPVLWNNEIVYSGHFFRQNRLLALNQITFEEPKAIKDSLIQDNALNAETKQNKEYSLSDLEQKPLPSKSYNPFVYLKRGLLFPVGSYTSEYFGRNAGYPLEANVFPFGITYITAQPWVNNNMGKYDFTCGWNPLSNSVGLGVGINFGSETGIFRNSIQLKSEFDKYGWKQSGSVLSSGSTITLGNISSVSITNKAVSYIGRQDVMLKQLSFYDYFMISNIGLTTPKDDTTYFKLADSVSLRYSNIHRTGTGRYENAGFALTVSTSGRYDATVNNNPRVEYVNLCEMSGNLTVCIPKLLPVKSEYGVTLNFPLTLSFTAFPTVSQNGLACDKNFYGNSFFDAVAETVIWARDIESTIPKINYIYVNNICISGGYAFTGDCDSAIETGFQPAHLGSYFNSLANGKGKIYDSVYLKTSMNFTINYGYIANNDCQFRLWTVLSYALHSERERTPLERFKGFIGFESPLNLF